MTASHELLAMPIKSPANKFGTGIMASGSHRTTESTDQCIAVVKCHIVVKFTRSNNNLSSPIRRSTNTLRTYDPVLRHLKSCVEIVKRPRLREISDRKLLIYHGSKIRYKLCLWLR